MDPPPSLPPITNSRDSFIKIKVGNRNFYSYYFPPRFGSDRFSDLLLALEIDIRTNVDPSDRLIIIGGDFNAKSTLWSSPRNYIREDTVCDFIISVGLTLANHGE